MSKLKLLFLFFCLMTSADVFCQTFKAYIETDSAFTHPETQEPQFFLKIKNQDVVIKSKPLVDKKGSPLFQNPMQGQSLPHDFIDSIVSPAHVIGSNFLFEVQLSEQNDFGVTSYLIDSFGRLMHEILSPLNTKNAPFLVTLGEPGKLGLHRRKLGIAYGPHSRQVLPIHWFSQKVIKTKLNQKTRVHFVPVELVNGGFIFEIDDKIFVADSEGVIYQTFKTFGAIQKLDDLIAQNDDGSQSLLLCSGYDQDVSQLEILKTTAVGFAKFILTDLKIIKNYRWMESTYFKRSNYGYFIAVLSNPKKETTTVLTLSEDGTVRASVKLKGLTSVKEFENQILNLSAGNSCEESLTPHRFLFNSDGTFFKLVD